MGKVSVSPAVCNYCGETWDLNHVGLCPKCRKGKKLIRINMQEEIHFEGSLNITGRREFYEKNKFIYGVNVILIVLSLLVGLLFGPFGSIIGSIISFLNYFYGPIAITKVREIKNWKIK